MPARTCWYTVPDDMGRMNIGSLLFRDKTYFLVLEMARSTTWAYLSVRIDVQQYVVTLAHHSVIDEGHFKTHGVERLRLPELVVPIKKIPFHVDCQQNEWIRSLRDRLITSMSARNHDENIASDTYSYHDWSYQLWGDNELERAATHACTVIWADSLFRFPESWRRHVPG